MKIVIEKKWSDKYKRSIDCDNPKGFSQKAHCAGRKKNEGRDPKKGTGKKPKGSGRRLYTDENPKDTVSVKFSTVKDIRDTLSKASFKSKSHKRQSQIINLIHQRVRVAKGRTKDPVKKKRLAAAFRYISKRKEASKRKTQRMKKEAVSLQEIKIPPKLIAMLKAGGTAAQRASTTLRSMGVPFNKIKNLMKPRSAAVSAKLNPIAAASQVEANLLMLLQKLKNQTSMRDVLEGEKTIAQINKLLKNSNQPDHQGILKTINAGFGYAVKGADPRALKYLDRVIDNTKEGMIGLRRAAQQPLEEIIIEEIDNILSEKCWPGYEKRGMKTMFGKRYPNCVKKTKKKRRKRKKRKKRRKNENIEEHKCALNEEGKDCPVHGKKACPVEEYDVSEILLLDDEMEESLADWFGKSSGTTKSGRKVGGWVQVGGKYDGAPCAKQPGQKTKPKCVSSAKRRSMSKKERDSAARRKRKKDSNPNRRGKPINVSTDPKRKRKRKRKKRK